MNKIKTLLKSSPWAIALVYVLVGILWIQFSDQLVLTMFEDPDTITSVQSLKGWFFVVVSAILIFLLISTSNGILGDVIEDLQKANKKFKATIEHAPVGIAHHLPNETWLEVNKTMCDLLGYSREELMTGDFSDFIHPEDLQRGREMDRKLVEGSIQKFNIEKRYIRKDGTQFHGMVRKSVVFNGENEPQYLIVVLEDISKEKEYENEIKRALQEKEVLLGEVHHRVKNNLALISALFDLENMYTSESLVHEILNKSKVRIKCLAMIHETFSDSINTANIQFDRFLDELVDFLGSQLIKIRKSEKVEVKKNLAPVQLNINLAIPVSLILTELMINAGPGKFDDVKHPTISVTMEDYTDSVGISIKDNGMGIFEKHEAENSETLTSTIVHALVAQVNGSLESYTDKDGSVFTLTFDKKEMRGPANNIEVSKSSKGNN